MKKKIIFSSYDDIKNPYYGGGGAIAIREVAMRCPAYDITVITGNYRGAKNKVDRGVHYKRIGPSFLGPRLSQLVFHLLLPFYAKTESFDLWVESFTPPFSTTCLQLFTKKPVIGLVHMLSAEDMLRKYKLPFHLIENRGLKTYRHFLVLTDTMKSKMTQLNPKATIAMIPNGVSPKKIPGGQNPSAKYILYIGRLEFNQKGLDLLLDAYASIQHKTGAKLVIAGGGKRRDERALARKISKLGLATRVEVVGRVGGKRKENLLHDCCFVVVPSRLETFGIVALEAMAFGKPLVSFDIKGLRWIPRACVETAQAFNTQDLGGKMYGLLSSENLRATMSAAAKQAASNYSWEDVAKQYHAAIEKVLSL